MNQIRKNSHHTPYSSVPHTTNDNTIILKKNTTYKKLLIQ